MDLIIDVAQSDQPLLGAGAIAWKPVRERLDPAVGAVSAQDSIAVAAIFTRLHRIRGLAPQGGKVVGMDERGNGETQDLVRLPTENGRHRWRNPGQPILEGAEHDHVAGVVGQQSVLPLTVGKGLRNSVPIGDIAPRQCDPVAAPGGADVVATFLTQDLVAIGVVVQNGGLTGLDGPEVLP